MGSDLSGFLDPGLGYCTDDPSSSLVEWELGLKVVKHKLRIDLIMISNH